MRRECGRGDWIPLCQQLEEPDRDAAALLVDPDTRCGDRLGSFWTVVLAANSNLLIGPDLLEAVDRYCDKQQDFLLLFPL